MGPVNIREARRRLSELVDAVERGESVMIMRRGKEVARLVPIDGARGIEAPDLSAFRASIRLKGKSLSRVVADMRAADRY